MLFVRTSRLFSCQRFVIKQKQNRFLVKKRLFSLEKLRSIWKFQVIFDAGFEHRILVLSREKFLSLSLVFLMGISTATFCCFFLNLFLYFYFCADLCSSECLDEVEIFSLLEEQIPKYKIRADTLTQFSGYENQVSRSFTETFLFLFPLTIDWRCNLPLSRTGSFHIQHFRFPTKDWLSTRIKSAKLSTIFVSISFYLFQWSFVAVFFCVQCDLFM